ncbi:MAG: class C sortase [Bifidobacterium aquikefiri]|uniref:Sortase n=1 Tax=Bifidobacterium aquikefiri TaxID=1653207 RepID=A0A261GAQ5_9BIFI|nr:class C sortase [Bifidobacterium aquikefiri]OZG68517.1 sortase [Bifidobacterium aquikefiri]
MALQFPEIIEAERAARLPLLVRVMQSRLWNITLAILICVGAAIALYPSGADWISAIGHAQTLQVYQSAVRSKNQVEQAQALQQATIYNDSLGPNTVLDPFAGTADGNSQGNGSQAQPSTAAASEKYNSLLDPAGDGVMATIVIAKIGLDLPIYHGTTEETLARGIGHLYGTSLPVGGEGTHAVLTGHNGYALSQLFSNVHKLVLGDTFQIHVEGETLSYKVDQIKVVLPNDMSSLQKVKGKDYVTLVTCTPTGVNSHRLLVRGVRVASSRVVDAGAHESDASEDKVVVPFPWWAVWLAAAVTAAVWVVAGPAISTPARHRRS